MEAQAYLFDALEMNDEASKTRKSIEFVIFSAMKILRAGPRWRNSYI